MTPQERQLVAQLFDRLAMLEREPRDAEAERVIREGLAHAPNAIYALVQTALLQDEALRRANDRIEALEAELSGDQRPGPEEGGFLDRLRSSMFGGDERRGSGSVPSVRPGDSDRRDDRWGGGPMGVPPPGYRQEAGGGGPGGGPFGGRFGSGYGGSAAAPGGPAGGGPFSGGGSFLGTAAAVAAGAIGGSLLLNSIRGMMGPAHAGQGQGALDPGALGSGSSPWGGGNAGNSDLARQAGSDDIGGAGASRQFGALDDGSRGASADRDSGSRAANADQDDPDPGYDDSDLDFGDDGDFDTV